MEYARYIIHPKDLDNFEDRFSRVYFGIEFCQELIPSNESIRRIVTQAEMIKKKFTYLTPYVTEKGILRLRHGLDLLQELNPSCEVVFNDWGVLRLIHQNYPDFEPVMGRLLIKTKKGPRIAKLLNSLPRTTKNYFQSFSLDVKSYQDFLLGQGVCRVEQDNLLQGMGLNLAASGLHSSVYIPFTYVATTRLCLTANSDITGNEDNIRICGCHKECQRYFFYLNNPNMPVPLIRHGNTIFFRNESVPDNLNALGIDRMVLQPELY